ncbi:MAG TPA: hypothetical protein VGC54_12745 [Planctomycetota bacterium]
MTLTLDQLVRGAEAAGELLDDLIDDLKLRHESENDLRAGKYLTVATELRKIVNRIGREAARGEIPSGLEELMEEATDSMAPAGPNRRAVDEAAARCIEDHEAALAAAQGLHGRVACFLDLITSWARLAGPLA